MLGNSVLVVIPEYGDKKFWLPFTMRAMQSVENQTVDCDWRIVDAGDLQSCRNTGGLTAETDYLIFLDADDTLSPTYIEEMLKGTGDIRVPSVHRHYEDGRIDTDQKWYTPIPLIQRNYIVVSAMIRTSLFKQLGGFHDYESLEDWDLWLRAEEAGATFEQIPSAVLHVNKRVGSRNSNNSYVEILNNAKQRRITP